MGIQGLIILAMFALPPTLLWAIFWRRRLAEPEPNHVILQLFLLGIVASLPFFLLQRVDFFTRYFSSIFLIILYAIFEESVKSLLLIFGVELNKKRFDKWEDGFEFGILIALGFAFSENIFYFWREYSIGGLSLDFWSIYFFRSLATMLAHMIFTGTMGYFYACAYLRKNLVPKSKHTKPLMNFWRNLSWVLRRPFHITIHHFILQKDSAYGHTSGEVILEGIFLTVILHAVFNIFLYFSPSGISLSFLAVPILVAGSWWYAKRFVR